jgi:hypothetical protein
MFKNDKLHGLGRIKNAQGQTFQGVFNNNELVTKFKAVTRDFE